MPWPGLIFLKPISSGGLILNRASWGVSSWHILGCLNLQTSFWYSHGGMPVSKTHLGSRIGQEVLAQGGGIDLVFGLSRRDEATFLEEFYLSLHALRSLRGSGRLILFYINLTDVSILWHLPQKFHGRWIILIVDTNNLIWLQGLSTCTLYE